MFNVLRRGQSAFQTEAPGPGWRPDASVVWIDLLRPTREEEVAVEAALALDLPTREEMAGNRWLAPIAHRFLSPELWRFTRRSVPRGVALGLFSGFIVPVGQIFLAAFTG